MYYPEVIFSSGFFLAGCLIMKMFLFLFTFLAVNSVFCQNAEVVRIHYSGGGDWYGNKTTWKNVLEKAAKELKLSVYTKERAHKILDPEFSSFPFAYISGHGNINFNEAEAADLRRYLIAGGFLYADDDYGMDKSFRKQMKKVFPELNFTELPFGHPIYNSVYRFPKGLPKIHEHDGGPPKGLALIYDGRVVCFYSLNTDISDGCEDEEIHNDSPQKRQQALKMAINIFVYALQN